MNDEFIITPGPAPDSALNPLRANLSRLVFLTKSAMRIKRRSKSFLKNYKAMIRETITYKGGCQIRKIYLFGILTYKSSKECCMDAHRYF